MTRTITTPVAPTLNAAFAEQVRKSFMVPPKEEVITGATPTVAATPTKGGKHMRKHHKKNVSTEFQATICGLQLQPRTRDVEGVHVYPIRNEQGEIIDITAKRGIIPIADSTEFLNIGIEKYYTLKSTLPPEKAQMLWRLQRQINQQDVADGRTGDDMRIVCGNIKKSDCVLGAMSKKAWDAYFGCDVRGENLWKVILPVMTPCAIEVKEEYSNIKSIRLRILDALVTPEGYPRHDGDIITGVRAAFYKHCDLVPAKRMDGSVNPDPRVGLPKDGAQPKLINRNWQMRATGRTTQGAIMPVIKAKPCGDKRRYLEMCTEFGYEPTAQDGFVTLDNLKTLKYLYKQGDILEFPITNIRIVKNKMKDWSSSMGAQCVANSDWALTREVLNAHDIFRKAAILKGAAALELEGVVGVLESDQEAAWDDAVTLPVKCAFSRQVGGKWYAPRFLRDTLYPRVESFYKDYGIKVRIDKDGFYLQGDYALDILENAYEKEHGVLQYFAQVPNKSQFKSFKNGDKITIKRDPNVGPSNMMTFQIAGENGSHDAIVLSWQALYAMFADVDGDTCGYETMVANTSTRAFPCLRRPAPGAKAPKTKPTEYITLEQYLLVHEQVGMSVLKSAADTGSLDLTTRQIIEERAYAGKPISIPELMELAQIRQDAIDGMKWTEMGVDDGKDLIVRNYGLGGMLPKLSQSPMTYRLLRKDAGQPTWGDIKRFEERIKLINACTPHADHPYHDFFMSLKGITGVAKDGDIDDSVFIKEQMDALWKITLGNYAAKKYSWEKGHVIALGNFLQAQYVEQSKIFLAYNDDDAKKKAYAYLKDYQRTLVLAKCTELFGTTTSPEAGKFQCQMVIYLGTLGFGKGRKRRETDAGDEYFVPYGKGGGAVWCVQEEHVLDIAEVIEDRCVAAGIYTERNPYMVKIRAAVTGNRQKVADKVAALNAFFAEEE